MICNFAHRGPWVTHEYGTTTTVSFPARPLGEEDLDGSILGDFSHFLISADSALHLRSQRDMLSASKAAIQSIMKGQTMKFSTSSAGVLASLKGQHFTSIDKLRYDERYDLHLDQ